MCVCRIGKHACMQQQVRNLKVKFEVVKFIVECDEISAGKHFTLTDQVHLTSFFSVCCIAIAMTAHILIPIQSIHRRVPFSLLLLLLTHVNQI